MQNNFGANGVLAIACFENGVVAKWSTERICYNKAKLLTVLADGVRKH
jgi:hypothetical protein